MSFRLGVLTSGGDCPGLNAAIRAVVRRAQKAYGFEDRVSRMPPGTSGAPQCPLVHREH